MVIKSNLKEYEVFIEQNMEFITLLKNVENAEYVIDKNVYELYKKYFNDISRERLIIIEAIEQNKIIDTALEICEKITEIPAKRNATLISIGGGIVQDITGFVANIMYRGIQWIFVPTTLLAACDSCIGGKTSLNYKKYKNLLGTFYPPDKIYICSQLFYSLSERDFKSGLGEVIKFNIMAGENGLSKIENSIDRLLRRDIGTIDYFINSSLEFKKRYIEIDEFDKGERIKLNFAHTFGHAIEVVTDYNIPHGTAVAIGMIMANHISYNRGYLKDEIVSRSENMLLRVIDIDWELLEKPYEYYINAIKKDKKQIDSSLTAVLITEYGTNSYLNVVHDLKQKEVVNSIEYFKRLYKIWN